MSEMNILCPFSLGFETKEPQKVATKCTIHAMSPSTGNPFTLYQFIKQREIH